MSLPCASGVMPAATDDDAPPLEPPGVCVRDHGLYVRPRKSFTVSRRKLNAGVLVRPMTMAPAFFQLATTGLSACAMRSRYAATPLTVAQPSWSTFSLMVTGTPCSVPTGVAARERLVGRVRVGERLLRQVDGHRVEPRIDGVHALDARGRPHRARRSSRLRIAAAMSAASHVQRGPAHCATSQSALVKRSEPRSAQREGVMA